MLGNNSSLFRRIINSFPKTLISGVVFILGHIISWLFKSFNLMNSSNLIDIVSESNRTELLFGIASINFGGLKSFFPPLKLTTCAQLQKSKENNIIISNFVIDLSIKQNKSNHNIL